MQPDVVDDCECCLPHETVCLPGSCFGGGVEEQGLVDVPIALIVEVK